MPGLRLRDAFLRVTRFVLEATPYLAGVGLRGDCREVLRCHRHSPRAFFHALHLHRTICTWAPLSDALPMPVLIGMLLHEYGHIAGNVSEEGADEWVFEALGVPIEYRDYGNVKALEWVDPRIIRAVGI
jgi:hypothetical protein